MKLFSFILFILLFLSATAALAYEQTPKIEERPVSAYRNPVEGSPKNFAFELQGGFWLPDSGVMRGFFTNCCNIVTRLSGSILMDGRFGLDASAGVMYKSASAIGQGTGRVSGDRFNLLVFPIEYGLSWRADYFSWRFLIPYAKTGFDSWIFRQGMPGSSVSGVKMGTHFAGGLMVNVGDMADIVKTLDDDFGINDFFVTLESRYQWINNFGGGGLDFSGWLFSLGVMIEM